MNKRPLPKARKSRLVVTELAGETLVYDRDRDKAHCLNQTAAFVWQQCDGKTTAGEAAKRLETELKTPAGEEMVWLALKQLERSQLLEESMPPAFVAENLNRRTVMKRLGVAALVAVPLVTSVVAPTAAEAATCAPAGAPCSSDAQCCSNSCFDNGRGGFECA